MSELLLKSRDNKGRVIPKNKSKRNSSIELLKIIGILLIIVSHVVQTLIDKNNIIDYKDYIVNLREYVPGLQYYILTLMRFGGIIGNSIFFICSAWYLVDSNKNNVQKILQMVMDVFIISMCWLTFAKFDSSITELDTVIRIKSFFPITFSNNWYVTAYIVFCFLHISLNKFMQSLDKVSFFRITLVLFTMYIAVSMPVYFIAKAYAFQGATLILWVTIYFIIAYLKKYELEVVNNIWLNIALVIIGVVGLVALVTITRHNAIDGEFSKERILNWNFNSNPFALMLCLGLFNIARRIEFKCEPINFVSSLSLLIYVIHENEICRMYYRPHIWQTIYEKHGYDHILAWSFVQVIAFFVVSLVLATIYKLTIQRLTAIVSKWLLPLLTRLYLSIENKIIKD